MSQILLTVFAAIFSFTVISLILLVGLLLCRRISKRRLSERIELPSWMRNRGVPKHNSAPRVSSISIDESATFDPTVAHVSMQELIDVTRGFSPDLIIGDGSFGLVYKAQLNSGSIVAVKKLDPDAFQGLREFRAEVETLGKIQHSNIVKILGYCATGSDRVLIYEFIQKGSLDQWLYDTSSEDENHDQVLSWQIRMKIIRGVAMGLAFMHNLETPIIHRDIKASNILLDACFEAHIADFGLARRMEASHSHLSTQVAGTMGYMPPEYLYGVMTATKMGDVYSFGVLMLEIITGRRPSLPFPGEDGREVSLMGWINIMVEQNRFMEMVDAGIARDGLNEIVVVGIFNLGMRCAGEKFKDRPTMNSVVTELDKLLS